MSRKTRPQAFTDAAALAATRSLNGKSTGITAGKCRGHEHDVLEQMEHGDDAFTSGNVTTEFAISSTGPWVSNPSPATGYSSHGSPEARAWVCLSSAVVGGPSAQSVAGTERCGDGGGDFSEGRLSAVHRVRPYATDTIPILVFTTRPGIHVSLAGKRQAWPE